MFSALRGTKGQNEDQWAEDQGNWLGFNHRKIFDTNQNHYRMSWPRGCSREAVDIHPANSRAISDSHSRENRRIPSKCSPLRKFYDSVNHLKSPQYPTDAFGHCDCSGLFLIVLKVTIQGIIPESLTDFNLALYEVRESDTRTILSFCDSFPHEFEQPYCFLPESSCHDIMGHDLILILYMYFLIINHQIIMYFIFFTNLLLTQTLAKYVFSIVSFIC